MPVTSKGVPNPGVTMGRLRLGLAIAVLLTACGGDGESSAELEAAEERWVTSGISDYHLVIEYGCFCVEERRGPFEVDVKNGVVVEVRFDGAVIEPQPGITPVEVFTVEGLFGEIRSSLDADEITVSYGERGNPTFIDIDRIADAADDELTITAVLTVP